MTTISDPSAMTPDDPRWLSWFMQQRRFDRLSRKAQTGASLITDFASGVYEMGYPGQRRGNYELSDIVKDSRSTGGGIINQLGQFEWVGTNVPRLTYDPVTLQPLGLLVEEQRTNLLLQSSEVSTASWAKTAISAVSSGTSPDGIPAEKITPTAGAGNHFYGQAAAFAGAVDNGVFSISLRIKADGYNNFHIQGKTKSDLYPAANVDLAAGTITLLNSSGGATATISPLPDGWYLCSLSWNVLTGAQPLGMFLTPKPTATNSVSFTADGVSGALVAGHMTEQASSPSSYIPTTTAQVTRAADVCSVNTLSPWYNPLEGALVVEGIPSDGSGVLRAIASLDNSTTANRIQVRHTGTTAGSGVVVAGNVVQAGSFVGAANSWPIGAKRKAALSFSVNAFAFSCNGETVQVDESGTVPTVTRLSIGQAPGNSPFNGIIASITYYPRVIDVQQASA